MNAGAGASLPGGVGLALVGYRGTGKSTVGRLLARELGREFFDADLALEERYGRSIRSIFEREGEPTFRDWEEAVFSELVSRPGRKVIATGGGVVLREANRRLLKSSGVVVWLRADASVLAERLRSDEGRPALTAAGTVAEIGDVLAQREPLYQSVSEFAVDTDGLSSDEVAWAVLVRLSRGEPWA
jgi:shikimate kinase